VAGQTGHVRGIMIKLAGLCLALSFLTSCAPNVLYPIAGAGAGAGIAGIVSDGDPLWTTVGAVAGAGGGYLLANANEKSAVKKYNNAYDNGQSDASKQLGEAQSNLQKPSMDSTPLPRTRIVSIPAPRKDSEGINYVDTDYKVRVEDN
jgi:hypothetical protein